MGGIGGVGWGGVGDLIAVSANAEAPPVWVAK